MKIDAQSLKLLSPSASFLYVLSTAASAVEGGLEIFQEDLELFKRLKAQSKNISDSDAIKLKETK